MTDHNENPFDLAFACENKWTIHLQQQQVRANLLQSRKGTEGVVATTPRLSNFNSSISQYGPSPPRSEVFSPSRWGAGTASPGLSSKLVVTCNESTNFASLWRNDSEMTPPDDFDLHQHTPDTVPHDISLSSEQAIPPLLPQDEKRRSSASLETKRTLKKNAPPESIAVLNMASPYTSSTPRTTDGLKRTKFLERNRTAAVKCRERKKVWAVDLAKRAQLLESSNHQYSIVISALNSEMTFLKKEVLKHARCGPDRNRTSSVGLDYTTDSTSVDHDPQTIGTGPIGSRTAHISSATAIYTSVVNDVEASKGDLDSTVIPSVDDGQMPSIDTMSENELEALLTDQLARDTNSI
ncbi:Alcohol O-acetyltransferase [Xylographa bjoerkii]|nr:Alcohol O-acetyltransferase [Xylographa bjoerkii]